MINLNFQLGNVFLKVNCFVLLAFKFFLHYSLTFNRPRYTISGSLLVPLECHKSVVYLATIESGLKYQEMQVHIHEETMN